MAGGCSLLSSDASEYHRTDVRPDMGFAEAIGNLKVEVRILRKAEEEAEEACELYAFTCLNRVR